MFSRTRDDRFLRLVNVKSYFRAGKVHTVKLLVFIIKIENIETIAI